MGNIGKHRLNPCTADNRKVQQPLIIVFEQRVKSNLVIRQVDLTIFFCQLDSRPRLLWSHSFSKSHV